MAAFHRHPGSMMPGSLRGPAPTSVFVFLSRCALLRQHVAVEVAAVGREHDGLRFEGVERSPKAEIRARTSRHASAPRVAEVLAGLGLLEDDTVPAVRSWIGRRTAELPPGFAPAVRDWLLVLLDGDARSRPRSATTVYCTAVEPLIGAGQPAAATCGRSLPRTSAAGWTSFAGTSSAQRSRRSGRCSGSPGSTA